MTGDFTHIDESGNARMVDVSQKAIQKRTAIATARLVCNPSTIEAVRAKTLKKGDPIVVAQVAGIQGAKKTSELIPLCHNIPLENIEVKFEINTDWIDVFCTVTATAKTGVEMETLMGAFISALTLYDMCKAIDKDMKIEGVRLIEKIKQ